MKLSNILTAFVIVLFVAGLAMIAMGTYFYIVLFNPSGEAAMLDFLIGLAFPVLGVLLIVAAFKVANRVKKSKR